MKAANPILAEFACRGLLLLLLHPASNISSPRSMREVF